MTRQEVQDKNERPFYMNDMSRMRDNETERTFVGKTIWYFLNLDIK